MTCFQQTFALWKGPLQYVFTPDNKLCQTFILDVETTVQCQTYIKYLHETSIVVFKVNIRRYKRDLEPRLTSLVIAGVSFIVHVLQYPVDPYCAGQLQCIEYYGAG